MHLCNYCQQTFSNSGGKATHVPYCKLNPERIQRVKSPNAHARKGSTNWAKGLKKETDARITSRKGISGSFKNKTHSSDTKARLSEVAKERKIGGYIQGSGRGKKGWYKGFFCDSSWELAYIIYCLDKNLDIRRNTEKRKYEYNGVVKNYIPDFIVNGVITEIKGYKTAQWLAKLSANPDVSVLYKTDLQPIFAYVKAKYGADYINMYE